MQRGRSWEEFLEEQRKEVGELQFRQEYLAEFVEDEKTYFSMPLLREAVHVCEDAGPCDYCKIISGKSLPTGELYAGYDPGGLSDPAALVVVEKVSGGEKPSFRVVLAKTLLAKDKEGSSDVHTQFTIQVSDLHAKLKFKKLIVDSTGIGNPILEHCRELKLPAEGVTFTSAKQVEVLSNLRTLLGQGRITLPDNLELLSNLNCITAKRNRVGGYVFDHGNGTHDDLAYALALAVSVPKKVPTIIMMRNDQPRSDLTCRERLGGGPD